MFQAVYGDTAPEPVGEVYLDSAVFLRAGRYSLELARADEPATALALMLTGGDCH